MIGLTATARVPRRLTPLCVRVLGALYGVLLALNILALLTPLRLSLTVAMPAAAVVLIRRALPLPVLAEPGRSVVLATVLALLAGGAVWLHGRVGRLLDRLLLKDSYDYPAALQGLSRDLSLVGDLDTLGTAVPETLRRLMNLDYALLLVREERGVRACGAEGLVSPALRAALVATAHEVRDQPRVVPVAAGGGARLLVPLRTHDTLVGHLCLGPKISGGPSAPKIGPC